MPCHVISLSCFAFDLSCHIVYDYCHVISLSCFTFYIVISCYLWILQCYIILLSCFATNLPCHIVCDWCHAMSCHFVIMFFIHLVVSCYMWLFSCHEISSWCFLIYFFMSWCMQLLLHHTIWLSCFVSNCHVITISYFASDLSCHAALCNYYHVMSFHCICYRIARVINLMSCHFLLCIL